MKFKTLDHLNKALFIYLFSFTCSDLVAQESCLESDDDLCVYVIEKADSFAVFARNTKHHDTSLEIEFILQNMTARGGAKQMHVVAPKSELFLTELSVSNRYQRSTFEYTYRYQRGNVEAEHDESAVYQLPYALGKTIYVGQSCDTNGTHKGVFNRFAVDFIMPIGTPVHAARAGRVIDFHQLSDSGGTSSMHMDKGNFIEIQHKDGTVAHYHHLRIMGVKVDKGEQVSQGQFIGLSGNTGFSSGPHLHFAVTKLESLGKSVSLKVPFQAKRGIIKCPRFGLALTAIAVK